MHILVINPGGTSTKVALYDDERLLFNSNIQHDDQRINAFACVFDQLDYRREAVEAVMHEEGFRLDQLACVVGRGGLLRRMEGGTYAVNDAMIETVREARFGEHPSNLGAVLARCLGDAQGIASFVVDPVSVDEFWDIARYSGLAELERPSWMHALNQKAVCREVAAQLKGKYADFNFIVAHLGSGISIAVHTRGRMVDGSGGRTNGAFSPERCGGLPTYPLVNLCYSGKYTHRELVDKISTGAGMFDYLGTKDMRDIEARYLQGEADVTPVFNAFIYQVSKDIARYGASVCGKVDRIILTGGIAYSPLVVRLVTERVGYLAPVVCLPGEMEMEALARGALRVLRGEETAATY